MLVIALVMGMTSGSAWAQNSDAEALFADGERLQAEGKLDEACDTFEASNRIEPRAGTLLRVGQCREAQGRLTSAWSAYKDALTRAKDPKKREFAEQRVAALAPRLSYLTVSVPDESRVDGLKVTRNGRDLDSALWNRAAPVDGGSYTISGSAPGHEEWRTTVNVANEGDHVTVDVPRFKELSKLVDNPPPPGSAVGNIVNVTVGNADASPFTPKRKIAAGVAGVGAVAIIGGVVLGMQAKGLEDDALRLCPQPNGCPQAGEAQEKLDSANSKALMANIAFGVGGAAVIGAAVLWITGKPQALEAKQQVSARVQPGLVGVDFTVRF
jgi:hypothetical protein